VELYTLTGSSVSGVSDYNHLNSRFNLNHMLVSTGALNALRQGHNEKVTKYCSIVLKVLSLVLFGSKLQYSGFQPSVEFLF